MAMEGDASAFGVDVVWISDYRRVSDGLSEMFDDDVAGLERKCPRQRWAGLCNGRVGDRA